MTSPGTPRRPSDFPNGGCAATGWTPTGDRKVHVKEHRRPHFYYLEVRAARRTSDRSKHLKYITSTTPACGPQQPQQVHSVTVTHLARRPKNGMTDMMRSAVKHFRQWVDHHWQQSKTPMGAEEAAQFAPRLRGKPRGKKLKMTVRKKRKASRKAESNEKLKGQLEADIKSRYEQIEKLKKVLLEDDVS